MISLEGQQKIFLNISKKLPRKITVYAIGGTAITFMGLKDTTLDMDLVFENESDKDIFKETIKFLGYREIDPIKIYGTRRNQPEMLTLDNERFDLFVVNVIDFVFSDSMQERATEIHQFDDKLMLKVADPHDIILMKCATERVKDMDDARKIINNKKIEWNLLIEEVKKQISLGKERAAFNLGYFLEELNKLKEVKIPKKILDELYSIMENRLKEKQKKN